jgi:phosphoglycerol transferase MdoB-like AlkP superfamily enzyme
LEAAYPNQDLDPEIRNYMLKLIEFDTMLGDLMDRLEDAGELDETLFVVFPDHYPYMMDEDVYLDHIGIDGDVHEVMRQTLILYATDMTGEVVHTTGSQIDIAPTILNMIHSDGVFDYFMGTDLLGTDQNYVIFSDLTITDGTNILYLDEEYRGDPTRFDVLEAALADRITMLEIQKDLLNSDYFRQRAE